MAFMTARLARSMVVERVGRQHRAGLVVDHDPVAGLAAELAGAMLGVVEVRELERVIERGVADAPVVSVELHLHAVAFAVAGLGRWRAARRPAALAVGAARGLEPFRGGRGSADALGVARVLRRVLVVEPRRRPAALALVLIARRRHLIGAR